MTQRRSRDVLKIETASGEAILADAADKPLLDQFSWYVNTTRDRDKYAHARLRGTRQRVSMHRLLMNPPAGMVVHHRNGNGLDNRRQNLEVTTQRQNTRYIFDGKETGAHLHKQTGKWRSQARDPSGKIVSLGMHLTRADALEAAARYRRENPGNIFARRVSHPAGNGT